MDFRKLALEDKAIYERFGLGEFLGSEFNFAITWLEDLAGEAEICDLGDMAFVRTKLNGAQIYYPPLLKDQGRLAEAVQMLGANVDIRGLTKQQARSLGKGYRITTDRGEWDYIYCAGCLAKLEGRKYHSKRNFVRRLEKLEREFREYDEALDKEGILELCKRWSEVHNTQDLWWSEEQIIGRALDNWRELDLKIGVLYVGGQLAGFSVNWVGQGVAHTFFEKADNRFVGAYQAINQYTAKAFFDGVKYVNRHNDMNIEGLRKSKLSYHPVMILEKYRATN